MPFTVVPRPLKMSMVLFFWVFFYSYYKYTMGGQTEEKMKTNSKCLCLRLLYLRNAFLNTKKYIFQKIHPVHNKPFTRGEKNNPEKNYKQLSHHKQAHFMDIVQLPNTYIHTYIHTHTLSPFLSFPSLLALPVEDIKGHEHGQVTGV